MARRGGVRDESMLWYERKKSSSSSNCSEYSPFRLALDDLEQQRPKEVVECPIQTEH
jgi:hypothetical protein